MTFPLRAQALLAPAIVFALFLAAVMFRPLLPIDETRYMTAAWEMHLRGDWFAPLTINFAPYHHKPPLLLWLINVSWSLFGVSRWAGALPMALAGLSWIFLTRALALKLFTGGRPGFDALPFLVTGSVPFLIYGTLVMFDVTLTVFVLCGLLALVCYAGDRRFRYVAAVALAAGLGVLTKGPVAWLYLIFPMILGSLWIGRGRAGVSWYGGCLLALLLSTIPVLLWLVPVLQASDNEFGWWLVWHQTAGRITGGMENAHDRPFYFYLPLLPVLFLPWMLFPSFWRGVRGVRPLLAEEAGLRFLLCWIVPVFIAFSLIGGKQPHYLVPLLPGVLIFIARVSGMARRKAALTAAALAGLLVAGQAVASASLFRAYDLEPIAAYMQEHSDRDWAFVRNYQGELTFLARFEKPVEDLERKRIGAWLAAHPGGLVVVKYKDSQEIEGWNVLLSMPYRGRNLAVIGEKET